MDELRHTAGQSTDCSTIMGHILKEEADHVLPGCTPVAGGNRACRLHSFIPLYSYTNKESDSTTVPVPRPVENFYRAVSLRPKLPTDVPSGASKASIANVP